MGNTAKEVDRLKKIATELFFALRDMRDQHKCGCKKKGCNRCEDDQEVGVLLRKTWI